MIVDPRSVAGKRLEIASRTDVLVVGAGPAGIAAARRAHSGGADVLVVDENPVAFETMGESVPQLWGGRMGAEVRNRNAMMERMLKARPELAELYELGVDVRLGTACWGLFVNRPNLGWMPGRVAGLIDAEQGSHLVSFEQAIVATGYRDMGLAVPGWELPGVAGLSAALSLSRLYGAFEGRKVVVLGSTDEALLGVADLVAMGVRVVAVVEQAARPPAGDDLVARTEALGVPILCGETVCGVMQDTGEVRGISLHGSEVACDTILLGIGAVPMIDLVQSAGARTVFDNDRGGFVPVLGDGGETTVPGIRVAGDCAGTWIAKSADEMAVRREGEIAAEAALAVLAGKDVPTASAVMPLPPPRGWDIGAYRKDWVRAVVLEQQDDMPVCQCEEVTAREILEVRPPRYLDAPAREFDNRDLAGLLGEGPPDPDQIKRLTRAGMGPCQGRRCREQVQALLALRETLELADIPLAGYRNPVRPLGLTVLSPANEDPAIAEQWDSWFGMPRQWVPFWEAETGYTVAGLSVGKDHVSE